jgi:hypothetical protein
MLLQDELLSLLQDGLYALHVCVCETVNCNFLFPYIYNLQTDKSKMDFQSIKKTTVQYILSSNYQKEYLLK